MKNHLKKTIKKLAYYHAQIKIKNIISSKLLNALKQTIKKLIDDQLLFFKQKNLQKEIKRKKNEKTKENFLKN